MASSLTDIVNLSNRAVRSLVRGDLKQANALLESALRDFYQGLEDDVETEDPNVEVATRRLDPIVRPVPLHSGLCASDYTFCAENAFRIYNHGFFLSLSHLERDEVASVLLYNFGLVLLKRGILEGKQRLLRKSIKIYNMAVEVLQDDAMLQQNEQGFGLLQLAVLANQGFIYSYNLEFDNVLLCKDHIKPIMHNAPRLRSSEDVVFFLQTVVSIEVFGLGKFHLSPAA